MKPQRISVRPTRYVTELLYQRAYILVQRKGNGVTKRNLRITDFFDVDPESYSGLESLSVGYFYCVDTSYASIRNRDCSLCLFVSFEVAPALYEVWMTIHSKQIAG